jgi:hypothetical protein
LSAAITDAKARTDVEDNFRKTAGQLLGGAAVLIGAGFAYVQFTQQQRDAHDLLISNQVAKGFELLGNKDDKVEQRLGGIYALEGVMNTSEQYHRPVLEALCAFVRDRTQPRNMAGKAERFGPGRTQYQLLQDDHSSLGADVQTALTAIGRWDKPATDLSSPETDIQAALTVIGRREAAKTDVVYLRGAYIANADLGDANLLDADLGGAFLSLANLSKANLSKANLSKANLYGSDLHGANLNDAELDGADLRGANLRDAKLIGADLSGANLNDAELDGADLDDAEMVGTDLRGADLSVAKNLTQLQLFVACGDEKTKLDPPLTIKLCPTD